MCVCVYACARTPVQCVCVGVLVLVGISLRINDVWAESVEDKDG